jgi:hypothetical protein
MAAPTSTSRHRHRIGFQLPLRPPSEPFQHAFQLPFQHALRPFQHPSHTLPHTPTASHARLLSPSCPRSAAALRCAPRPPPNAIASTSTEIIRSHTAPPDRRNLHRAEPRADGRIDLVACTRAFARRSWPRTTAPADRSTPRPNMAPGRQHQPAELLLTSADMTRLCSIGAGCALGTTAPDRTGAE